LPQRAVEVVNHRRRQIGQPHVTNERHYVPVEVLLTLLNGGAFKFLGGNRSSHRPQASVTVLLALARVWVPSLTSCRASVSRPDQSGRRDIYCHFTCDDKAAAAVDIVHPPFLSSDIDGVSMAVEAPVQICVREPDTRRPLSMGPPEIWVAT
jgi:hypothetical protein